MYSINLAVIFGICICNSNAAIIQQSSYDEPPVVSLDLGKVRGAYMTTRLDNRFLAYRGIRYAEAPIGELRLQVRHCFFKRLNRHNKKQFFFTASSALANGHKNYKNH